MLKFGTLVTELPLRQAPGEGGGGEGRAETKAGGRRGQGKWSICTWLDTWKARLEPDQCEQSLGIVHEWFPPQKGRPATLTASNYGDVFAAAV